MRRRLLLPNQLFHGAGAGTGPGAGAVIVHDPVLFGYAEGAAVPRPPGGNRGSFADLPLFPVHKGKLAYMLAAARHYAIRHGNVQVVPPEDAEEFYKGLANVESAPLYVAYDPLDRRIEARWRALGVRIEANPWFVLSPSEYTGGLRLTPVYEAARKKLGVLVGAASTDSLNRAPPDDAIAKASSKIDVERGRERSRRLKRDPVASECARIVERQFSSHFGDASAVGFYPATRAGALAALRRYAGRDLSLMRYQDAMVAGRPFGAHSVLSAAINVGLLGPAEVAREIAGDVADAARTNRKASHSDREGFVRQVVGWRELCMLVYFRARPEIDAMFPQATPAAPTLPPSWLDGTTGFPPLDDVIAGGAKTGYAHHISRLMVALNLAVLVGASPSAAYRWFMTVLAMDAYDWVMVANIGIFGYGLARVARKPYVSSSAYVLRMSDYGEKGAGGKGAGGAGGADRADRADRAARKLAPTAEPSAEIKGAPHWTHVWDALFYTHVAREKVPYFSRVLLGKPYLSRGADYWRRLAARYRTIAR